MDLSIKELVELAKLGAGLLVDKRPSIVNLARVLQIDRGSVYRWVNGETVPSREGHYGALESLAEFYVSFQSRRKSLGESLGVDV